MTNKTSNAVTNNNKRTTNTQNTIKIDHEYGSSKNNEIRAVPIKIEFFSSNNDVNGFIPKHKELIIKLGITANHLVKISPKADFKNTTTIQEFPSTTNDYKNTVNINLRKTKNNHKIAITHYVITKLSFRQIKESLRDELKALNIFITYNYWHRTSIIDTVNIGWFPFHHPNFSSKSTLKHIIIREFATLQFNETEIQFIQDKYNYQGNKVYLPKFYFNNTSLQEQSNSKKLRTKVTALQVSRQDVPLFHYLLSKLFCERYQQFATPMIPFSLRYTNHDVYIKNMEAHNSFLKQFVSIAICGVSEENMFSIKNVSLYDQILSNNDIIAIEPTSQTLEHGKWHVHTYASAVSTVQNHIDKVLQTNNIPSIQPLPKRLLKFSQPQHIEKYTQLLSNLSDQQQNNQLQDAIATFRKTRTNKSITNKNYTKKRSPSKRPNKRTTNKHKQHEPKAEPQTS